LIEYRRAENRPWVAAFVQKHFKLAGRVAEQSITDVEEYFETLVYDEDISFAVCRAGLEKAFKERATEHLHIILERAKTYALQAG
jgi:hypothetical protein